MIRTLPTIATPKRYVLARPVNLRYIVVLDVTDNVADQMSTDVAGTTTNDRNTAVSSDSQNNVKNELSDPENLRRASFTALAMIVTARKPMSTFFQFCRTVRRLAR